MPDAEVIGFVKDWLWAPCLALVGWAWTRNEKEHDMLRSSVDSLKTNTSSGYSTLNDRIMEHMDEQVRDTRKFVQDEDAKLMAELNLQRGHIGKLFDKIDDHGKRSEDRHNEVLNELRAMTNSFHIALSQKADK